MNESYARIHLADTCARLYNRGLTVSAGGNMSVRLSDEEILITPSGRNKGMLNEGDMIVVDMEGKPLTDGKPSIETFMHLALYKGNPETNAVIHCHPLNCIALTMKGKIKTDLTPEGVILLGDVPTISYYTPGTQELVEAVRQHCKAKAILMTRHGAITQGSDLNAAFDRMEELEFQARLQMLVGRCKSLPKDEVERLKKL